MSSASLQLGGDNWAAKDGNLLGYQRSSSSSVHVPHEFTFTRGSNLAATRVAANGLIEKGRENLLLQSNQFDTTWSLIRTNILGGQSGYDASSDAWLFQPTNITPAITQSISNSGVGTYSVYAKANSVNWIRLQMGGSPSPSVYFDLDPNTIGNRIGTQVNNINASIQDIGNGWFRCSVTFNSSITSALIFPAKDDNVVGDINSTIYIQDAQLEQGLVATDYIETGATTVQAGLLEDEPRIDYTGGTGSLLLEPSRTNLIEQSEYFDSWTTITSGTGLTPIVTNNYTISPEGVKNATRVQLDIGTGTSDADFAQIQTSISTTTGTTYTGSIYFKSNTGVNQDIVFQINGQAIVATTITPQWTRYDVSAAATSTGGFFRIRIRGNEGTNKSADFSVYGAQIEEGSYPTSYIPNHSGGSVTRNAEYIEQATSSFDINGDYTFFFEVTRIEGYSSSNSTFVTLTNTTDSSILFIYNRDNDKNIRFLIREGSTGGDSIYSPVDSFEIGERVKFCIRKDSTKTEVFLTALQ